MTIQEAKEAIVKYGLYEHYKKHKLYVVFDIAQNVETDEAIIVYETAEVPHSVYVRSASSWCEEVAPGIKRFSLIRRMFTCHD